VRQQQLACLWLLLQVRLPFTKEGLKLAILNAEQQ
jgi:hypothetical protein